MSERDPVIIVGAGPAGLAVAAILAQAGVASRVFEAEGKLPRDLRAGSIHPRPSKCSTRSASRRISSPSASACRAGRSAAARKA